jgi:[ribosomal protein S18]-alanine N-acetyltransferase
MPVPRIEPMRVEDLDEVLDIERVSFPNPWSRHAFLYELRENRVARLWVGRAADEPSAPVIAYLCLWLIADEVHVTNFAVQPSLRQQGIGRQLMGTLLELYRQQGATRAALEVRPSNHGARRLYEAFGFRQVGLRRGYYFDTGEDALLMEARLMPDEGAASSEAPAHPRRAAGNSRP